LTEEQPDTARKDHLFQALADTVPVGVGQIDENDNVIFANPLFNAYCGGDGTDADKARLLARLRDIHPRFPGEACKYESVVQGLGSQPRNMIIISSGWLDLGLETRVATVSLVDISEMMELKRVNEDISRLNDELASNMRSLEKMQHELLKKGRMEQLGQLTATVAHELRNPLGAMRTSLFLLERKVKDKGLGAEPQIDRINKGIVRCDNIITQLLDFSRTKQLSCELDDLDAWLAGIVEEEAKRLPTAVSIELILGLEGMHVPFDPARLQRAVINMINNAVEAMVESERNRETAIAGPHLTISTSLQNQHVCLCVVDNGPGIPDDVLARIREPLFTTKSFGTGLGVPAIEQIAVQHGGKMEIETEVGKGTTVTIHLPCKAAEAA
jgi:signal transduction histidine kinase